MIAIIDYEAGNLTSVQRALSSLGQESIITSDLSEVMQAEKIIFPGVGAAGKAMFDLKRLGLDQALIDSYGAGKPILGICIGTQVIMEWSEENDTQCLGLIKGGVRRFNEDMVDEDGKRLKVPHMGWNGVAFKRDHPLFKGVAAENEFYFVHSYYPLPEESEAVLGETDYGSRFASVIAKKNLFAVQFHLEKSGRPGLRILSNFCEWSGRGNA
jgi:glutamine amidotransferase